MLSVRIHSVFFLLELIVVCFTIWHIRTNFTHNYEVNEDGSWFFRKAIEVEFQPTKFFIASIPDSTFFDQCPELCRQEDGIYKGAFNDKFYYEFNQYKVAVYEVLEDCELKKVAYLGFKEPLAKPVSGQVYVVEKEDSMVIRSLPSAFTFPKYITRDPTSIMRNNWVAAHKDLLSFLILFLPLIYAGYIGWLYQRKKKNLPLEE